VTKKHRKKPARGNPALQSKGLYAAKRAYLITIAAIVGVLFTGVAFAAGTGALGGGGAVYFVANPVADVRIVDVSEELLFENLEVLGVSNDGKTLSFNLMLYGAGHTRVIRFRLQNALGTAPAKLNGWAKHGFPTRTLGGGENDADPDVSVVWPELAGVVIGPGETSAVYTVTVKRLTNDMAGGSLYITNTITYGM